MEVAALKEMVLNGWVTREEAALKEMALNGWVTREEAARIINRSLKTVDRLRKLGRLESFETPRGRVMIHKMAIELYLQRIITPPEPPIPTLVIETIHYDELRLKAQHGNVASERLKHAEVQLQQQNELIQQLQQKLQQPRSVFNLLFSRNRKQEAA